MSPRPLVAAHTADIEAVMGDTITAVGDLRDVHIPRIYDRLGGLEKELSITLPRIEGTVNNFAISQAVVASSTASMADTFKDLRGLMERQEERHSKERGGAVPIKIYFFTVIGALSVSFVIAFGAAVYWLRINQTNIEATLKSISITQGTTQQKIEKATEELKKEVSKVATEVEEHKGGDGQ